MFPKPLLTLVDLLQYRANEQPEQIAYYFLSDGETEEISLTYQALDLEARKIAAQLQSLNLSQKQAILLYQPGLELICAFFGCLYADVVAIPAYPPQYNQNLSRLQGIITDSQASVILTTTALLKDCPDPNLSYLISDRLSDYSAHTWRKPKIDSDTLAFIQYTSGSTGSPKGVMLSHGNLLHNSRLIYQGFEHSSQSKVVSWLPPYHDMGLIGGILQPFYGGFPVVLMSPVSFIRKPIRWLQAISRYQATTSGGPNFAYNLCLEKITPQQKATLDLSSWKLAFIGAEPINPKTLDQFAEAFAPCGFRRDAFYPCYGLAEATLFVSGGAKNKPPIIKTLDSQALQQNQVLLASNHSKSQNIVSCGQIYPEQKVMIVDPTKEGSISKPLQDGEIGEIWVSGASVAQGYWKNPEKTKETFQSIIEGQSFLRTGDLGFLQNGKLYVTGRIKDLIIIRGQNYYPQDLEQTVEQCHVAIRLGCCAAFSISEGEEQLAIAAEIKRESIRQLNLEEVLTAIRSAIAQEHGLQIHTILLLKQGSIPKTSSGKIQRHACQNQYQDHNFDLIAHWSIKSSQKTDHLIQWLRSYANEQINSRLMDERRSISPSIVLDFGNQGLLGMQVPTEYGGLGLNHSDTMRILEQLGAIDTTLALFVGLNNILGIRPLLNFGSQNLKKELLPILATGRELAAFALTETGAGSNPQAITTKAVLCQDGWLLQGKKIWSGSAAWAGVINVFVQEPEGISGFIVRKGTSGLRQGPEALTMGMRGMVQNTVYLNDVPVQAEQRLGDAGMGMKVAQDAMMYGRLGIAAACVGGMKRCAQLMLRYSERRTIATGRLLDNPLMLVRLNELTATITAVEVLVKSLAKFLDRGLSVPVEAYTVCKIAAPEFYWQAADHLVQCLGGRGYIETNIAPQILRDARVLRIFEGPTETLKMFLGSRVNNQSEDLKSFFCDILKTPHLYENLINDAKVIQEYYLSAASPFIDPVTAKRWASILIGDLATFAILLAVLMEDSESVQKAYAWTQQQYELKRHQALSRNPLLYTNSFEIISQYESTIGDIEQTLAGEDYELDELLRKSTHKTEAKIVNVISTKTRKVKNNVTEIKTWLINWLSQKLKIPTQHLDPKQSFADYGIDSVIAVELAQDIQEWLALSQEVEATIAWNYPTIEALAQYLSQFSSNPEQPILDQELTEEQLQNSIAQEIIELENWLHR
ncbi:AMP-dependent synthetase [Aphanothece hegewaldii CCALA 016]|uniref:AMP-dependent synthetase n=1 Tax=Aphanothece hegewaldii CCALA 016 TaxID=2107694 RepID=A0A2T1LYD0_9CHRO|nr:AMP-dependent synthetase [Aphanothece hegewaldii CCALA 016]